jgi:hypothetical protein
VCFGPKKRSLLHKFKGNFAPSITRNLLVGLRFTRGTRILLRPDALCAIPSHPVGHVFRTLQWNCLGRASFEVHESQRDVRPGKLVFQMLVCGECYEDVYTSIVQHLTDADNVVRKEFCTQMFNPMQDDERFLDSVICSDESTFHVSGKINTYNCKIWVSENPRVFLEYVRGNPNVSAFAPAAASVRPLLLHGDDHYRYRVPGHAPTIPQEGRIHFQQYGIPPSLPWRNARVPRHPFHRSVDW